MQSIMYNYVCNIPLLRISPTYFILFSIISFTQYVRMQNNLLIANALSNYKLSKIIKVSPCNLRSLDYRIAGYFQGENFHELSQIVKSTN